MFKFTEDHAHPKVGFGLFPSDQVGQAPTEGRTDSFPAELLDQCAKNERSFGNIAESCEIARRLRACRNAQGGHRWAAAQVARESLCAALKGMRKQSEELLASQAGLRAYDRCGHDGCSANIVAQLRPRHGDVLVLMVKGAARIRGRRGGSAPERRPVSPA